MNVGLLVCIFIFSGYFYRLFLQDLARSIMIKKLNNSEDVASNMVIYGSIADNDDKAPKDKEQMNQARAYMFENQK